MKTVMKPVMKPMNKSLIALSLAGVLAACGGSGSSDTTTTPVDDGKFSFAATDMIANLSDNVIVAGYELLAEQANDMHMKTQTLVANPTAENLAAVQMAWKAARQPWEQGESHIFGPVDALSIDPHLDTWPLATNDLATQLANNSGFDANTVKTWNDNVQGFHTMEFLLFGDGVNDNEKSINEMTAKEREYLVALAEVFRDYTKDLDDAWQIDFDKSDAVALPYVNTLKNPGVTGGTYASEVAVIQELVEGMIGIIDEVGNGKIADPFGANLADADTSKVESQYSWNSLTDFSDNIIGVRNVYLGELTGQADKQGIIDFVMAADTALANRIDSEISTAIINIQNIAGPTDMPFRQAILDAEGRKRVQTAVDSLTTLQSSFEQDVKPLLSKWNGQ